MIDGICIYVEDLVDYVFVGFYDCWNRDDWDYSGMGYGRVYVLFRIVEVSLGGD